MRLPKNLIASLMVFLCASRGYGSVLSAEESKAFVTEMFSAVFEKAVFEERLYAKYFSKQYVQYVDGKVLRYDDFIDHLRSLKKATKSLKITFKRMVAEGDRVATIHIVDGEKRDGSRIKAQVHAVFEIRDGKLVVCEELTHLIEGTAGDRAMGSRR